MYKFRALASLLSLLVIACTSPPEPVKVRLATFNVAMGLSESGELGRRLEAGTDTNLAAVAEILQRVRPDVVLLNEFDYDGTVDAARLLQENYLSVPQNGQDPIAYPYAYAGPVNTGVDSGLDLDLNGQTGDPSDAWGFGRFPGQYGMLLMSRFPIDASSARTFREFRWRDMPGALQPVNGNGSAWYPEDTWMRLRLSSKNHWDLPIDIDGATLHFLASHPTPAVFDGPEDRNGTRNHDEIRLWADYVQPGVGDYLVDDAGVRGGLADDARFVIAGDLNADPFDGDSTNSAIMQLLNHPNIDASCLPQSYGGAEAALRQAGVNLQHAGDPGADTSDFNDERVGNLRIDYVLPSSGLKVAGCGVYWPPTEAEGHDLVSASDHRLVWLDIVLPPN